MLWEICNPIYPQTHEQIIRKKSLLFSTCTYRLIITDASDWKFSHQLMVTFYKMKAPTYTIALALINI